MTFKLYVERALDDIIYIYIYIYILVHYNFPLYYSHEFLLNYISNISILYEIKS